MQMQYFVGGLMSTKDCKCFMQALIPSTSSITQGTNVTLLNTEIVSLPYLVLQQDLSYAESIDKSLPSIVEKDILLISKKPK